MRTSRAMTALGVAAWLILAVPVLWGAEQYMKVARERFPAVWILYTLAALSAFVLLSVIEWLSQNTYVKIVLGFVQLLVILVGVVWPFVLYGLEGVFSL